MQLQAIDPPKAPRLLLFAASLHHKLRGTRLPLGERAQVLRRTTGAAAHGGGTAAAGSTHEPVPLPSPGERPPLPGATGAPILRGPGGDGAAAAALGCTLPGGVAQEAPGPGTAPIGDRGLRPDELLPPPARSGAGAAARHTATATRPGAGRPPDSTLGAPGPAAGPRHGGRPLPGARCPSV